MAWIQVEAFKKELKNYQARTSSTRVQAAKALETTPGNLKFWLSGVRSPKRENLQKAAALFGCSVTKFMDDPGADIPGATTDSSEVDRYMLEVMGTEMSRLSEPQKQAAFDAWRAIVRGFESSR